MSDGRTALARIEDAIDKQVANAIAVGAGGITFSTAGEAMEYAKMMSVSAHAVPKHLRGNPGACLGVVDDAIRLRMSPYALARKSYLVNDNLAYEAQVIAAIVLARAPIKQRPDMAFWGEGVNRRCKITFHFRDGSVRIYESPSIGTISPKNSPLWKTDPDQQLGYYSLRAAARRHCPDVILGIYDPDEFAGMKDVTPAPYAIPQATNVLDDSVEEPAVQDAEIVEEAAAHPPATDQDPLQVAEAVQESLPAEPPAEPPMPAIDSETFARLAWALHDHLWKHASDASDVRGTASKWWVHNADDLAGISKPQKAVMKAIGDLHERAMRDAMEHAEVNDLAEQIIGGPRS